MATQPTSSSTAPPAPTSTPCETAWSAWPGSGRVRHRRLPAMYGTDHAALPTLMQQVDALGAHPDGPRVRVATLQDYLGVTARRTVELMVVDGELRSHACANILPGVISVRWHLKDAMACAERTSPATRSHSRPCGSTPGRAPTSTSPGATSSTPRATTRSPAAASTRRPSGGRPDRRGRARRAGRPGPCPGPRGPDGPGRLAPRRQPRPGPRQDHVELQRAHPARVALRGPRRPRRSAGPDPGARPAGVELAREQVPAGRLPSVMGRVHDRELFGLQVARPELDEAPGRWCSASPTAPAPSASTPSGRRLAWRRPLPPRPADELWTLVIVDEPRRRLVAAVDTDGLGWSAWTPQRAEDPCGRTAEEVARPPPWWSPTARPCAAGWSRWTSLTTAR